MANTSQLNDILRNCLSSWKLTHNKRARQLREVYDILDGIDRSFSFWCFKLLKAPKMAIVEAFVQ